MLETMTPDHAVAARAHDALWAVLWNRRYDDVDQPLWLPDTAFAGVLAFAWPFEDGTLAAGVDIGDAFVVFHGTGAAPPIGSRVRVLPASREQWRFAAIQAVGLGVDLRFDDQKPSGGDPTWLETLRAGVQRLRELLDVKRERLAALRAQAGALSEPATLEEVWRSETAAINERIALQTEYTPLEHAALAKARAKGPRSFDEEQTRVQAARRRRFNELATAEVARFREGEWNAIRDRAVAETRRYVDYRSEVVRLEDAMQRIRALNLRTTQATRLLDLIENAGFRVRALTFEPERLDDPAYADELLRTVELLHAAIPLRAHSAAASFSAYRAPTAGPSVTPPRV
ncbi:MAG: hypothetical protein NVS3B7_18560 [Candidatus Elarobacter sp.]